MHLKIVWKRGNITPSLTVEKQKNGRKASKIKAFHYFFVIFKVVKSNQKLMVFNVRIASARCFLTLMSALCPQIRLPKHHLQRLRHLLFLP